MSTTEIFLIILLCLGALQGLIFGGILIGSKNQNKAANQILAVLLFLLSYRLLVQVMRLFGLGYYDGWYYIILDLSWVHGALLYFYTRALTRPDFRLYKRDWLHFIPLVLQVGISIFVRLQNLYWDGTRESLSWLGYWGYVAWMNNPTIYIVASTLIVYYAHRSEKLMRAATGDSVEIKPNRLRWIRRIIRSFKYYFAFVLVILLTDLLAFTATSDSSYFYFTRFYYYPFFLGLAILTYWIGMEGFARRDQEGFIAKKHLSASEKERLAAIAKALESAMTEEKVYTNPEISIAWLAEHLGVKAYLISRCLNEIMTKKFTDFINEYRVEEVQRLLADPKNSKYTLLSLAMEAGFNSKSSFNRAVKKHLGISPNALKSGS
jgi:AraC-like DNA-binding protein